MSGQIVLEGQNRCRGKTITAHVAETEILNPNLAVGIPVHDICEAKSPKKDPLIIRSRIRLWASDTISDKRYLIKVHLQKVMETSAKTAGCSASIRLCQIMTKFRSLEQKNQIPKNEAARSKNDSIAVANWSWLFWT